MPHTEAFAFIMLHHLFIQGFVSSLYPQLEELFFLLYQKVNIYLVLLHQIGSFFKLSKTTRLTSSGLEAFAMQSKAPEQLLNVPCGEIL